MENALVTVSILKFFKNPIPRIGQQEIPGTSSSGSVVVYSGIFR